ncbi:MAG: hypothetical protein ACK4N5_01890, partial [Myxococcales bacterium]
YHPRGAEGRFRAGVTARTGANISESAVAVDERFAGFVDPTAEDPNRIRYERRPQQSQGAAQSRLPPSLEIGVSYRILDNWLVAADGVLHSFEEYESFGRTITKRAVFNGSLGTEVLVRAVTLRAGAFTNRTAAPPSASLGENLLPDSYDQYGGTAGFTWAREKTSFILSARVGVMRGAASVQSPLGVGTETVPISGLEVGLTAGGSYFF